MKAALRLQTWIGSLTVALRGSLSNAADLRHYVL
ncbi:exported hypothetical protein [Agrobacterium deltaense NCPPB 1641]|uniref:Uncharacterized protein n=1 Tax=Agrobacterium deltaense NCPPB 1641 TaxID=1183425 RepID=A0A1S7U7D4_9HYPH|nr:exported hypothetical protein [Agrobacterium deltaense NCPPB 1641]